MNPMDALDDLHGGLVKEEQERYQRKLDAAFTAGEQAGLRRAIEMIIEQAKPRWLNKAEKDLLTETARAILAEAGEK